MKDLSQIKFLAVYAIQKGFSISVYDGEEWSLVDSTDAEAVVNEVHGVDQAQLKINLANSEEVKPAIAEVSFALDDAEQIMDTNIVPFWDEFDLAYDDFWEAEQ